ncbi:LuxR family transcriptional regulator [Arthrobacter sp. BHU FT2]|nr:LuxR family transcriptional regulator [Arthrobacter sp. BHU FT2]
MGNTLKTILLALLLLAAPAVSAGTAIASPPATAGSATGSVAMSLPAGNTPTPSPGDTSSTGPANPGTGESTENESTRVNYAPWIIGGIVVVVLIAVLLWNRRRNKPFVG